MADRHTQHIATVIKTMAERLTESGHQVGIPTATFLTDMILDLEQDGVDEEGVGTMYQRVKLPPCPFDKTENDTSNFPKFPVLCMKRNDMFEVLDKDEHGNYDCRHLWCFYKDAHLSLPIVYDELGKRTFQKVVKKNMVSIESSKSRLKHHMIRRLERYVETINEWFNGKIFEITDDMLNDYALKHLPEATAFGKPDQLGEDVRLDWCTAVCCLVQLGHKDCKTIVRESLVVNEAEKERLRKKIEKEAVQYEQDEERRVISHNLSIKLKAERVEKEEKERLADQAQLAQSAATRKAMEESKKESERLDEEEKASNAKQRANLKQQRKEQERVEKFGKKKKAV
jgi:hypothetical protein